MRLLILSSNNGAGHNSAGRALAQEAASRGIDCEMIDALALSSKASSRAIEEIHIKSALYAPQLFAWGNRVAEQMTRSERPSACYRAYARSAGKLLRIIREGEFDAAVATHVFPALMLTAVRRELGANVPSYFVATDYSCAPFVGETALDGWFIPHERLRSQFRKSGVPDDGIVATGIPTKEQFRLHMERAQARARLELPNDGPIALIMTGSMGFGSASEQIGALLQTLPDTAYVLLLCGNNDRLRAAVEERYGATGRVFARGYTDCVPLYLDACDVLLSKPGGLSSTEAAVHGIPLVLTTPIPGWESENVRFFASGGLAYSGGTPERSALQAARLLGDKRQAARMIACQRAQINPFAASDILDRVCAGAGASGERTGCCVALAGVR